MTTTSQELATNLNSTVIEGAKTSFESAIQVTQDPFYIIPVILLLALPILIYLIWGAVSSARTPQGHVIQGTNTIQTANFWIGFMIFIFFLSLASLLMIFPIWLKYL